MAGPFRGKQAINVLWLRKNGPKEVMKLPNTASDGQSDTKNEAILMNDDTSSIISRDEIEKELLLMACKAIELRDSGTLDDLIALVNGTADKICQIASQ